ASSALVVGEDDVPRRMLAVGVLEHKVTRLGVVVPALVGFDVHRALLPLPHRIIDTRMEPALLLFLPDLEPDLDQPGAALDQKTLEDRAELEEPLVLFLGTEAHDIFDASAVVPAAVEDHD